MRFIDIHIDGFGKFHNFDMHLDDGMNIIYGHNEAGKSTLHSFLQAMLYGLGRRSGKTLSKKYQSWEYPDDYSGQLRIEDKGKRYLIHRDFNENTISVYNETDHEEIKEPEVWLHNMLDGISETAFENTVSIGQLHSATSRGMINELKSCIRNLNSTGDLSLDSAGALEILNSQKEQFKSKLVPDAAKTYAQLVGEIRNIERDIQQPEYENHLRKYQNLRTEVRTEQVDRQTKKEELLQKVAAQEATLQQSGLRDDAEIQNTVDFGNRMYSTYQSEVSRQKDASRVLLPIGLFVLAGVSLVLDVLFASAGLHEVGAMFNISKESIPWVTNIVKDSALGATIPVALCTFFFVLFLMLAITLLHGNSTSRKSFDKASRDLENLLNKYIGTSDISEAAINSFRTHMDELLKINGELTSNKEVLDALTQELQGLNDDERRYDVELQKQNEKQTELEGKLQHLVNVKNRAEMLKRTISVNDALTEEIDAINLAYETLTELEASIKQSFGHYLNKEAGDLISGITGGVYDSIWIDHNLDIFMNTPAKLVPIEDVSTGTMDQIYLALRLAASRLMQSNGANADGTSGNSTTVSDSDKNRLPLIFDDSFAMYDEKRLNSALHFIMDIHPGQILLFTCHTRERRILKESKDKFNVIELP